MKESINQEVDEKTLEPNTKLRLISFEGVGKFRSISRAFRRGHISSIGVIYPKRPFNNRKNKAHNELKKQVYAEVTKYGKYIQG